MTALLPIRGARHAADAIRAGRRQCEFSASLVAAIHIKQDASSGSMTTRSSIPEMTAGEAPVHQVGGYLTATKEAAHEE